MARTIRVYWPNQSTGWLNFNWGGVINSGSVVHISACEAGDPPEPTIDPSGSDLAYSIGGTRKRGDAFIGVRNVHPHDDGGGVEFVVEVLWGSPLNVVVDITVEDPAEDGLVVW